MSQEPTTPDDYSAETATQPGSSLTRARPKDHTHMQLVAMPIWTGFPNGSRC